VVDKIRLRAAKPHTRAAHQQRLQTFTPLRAVIYNQFTREQYALCDLYNNILVLYKVLRRRRYNCLRRSRKIL